MSRPWVSDRALLVVPCFSRHLAALDWARDRLEASFGPIALISPDFYFHHTKYYEAAMGTDLRKRIMVFDRFYPKDGLPDAKNRTIALEAEMMAAGAYPEARPLNLDPGLLQLGKFLLATTKDQAHRIYLRDGIYAEVTLRFTGGGFEAWPWTYADYQEPAVRSFLAEAREFLAAKIQRERRGESM